MSMIRADLVFETIAPVVADRLLGLPRLHGVSGACPDWSCTQTTHRQPSLPKSFREERVLESLGEPWHDIGNDVVVEGHQIDFDWNCFWNLSHCPSRG